MSAPRRDEAKNYREKRRTRDTDRSGKLRWHGIRKRVVQRNLYMEPKQAILVQCFWALDSGVFYGSYIWGLDGVGRFRRIKRWICDLRIQFRSIL